MIGHINQMVLESFKQYNSALKDISIINNILYYNEESLNLELFRLDTLLESYKLQTDFNFLTAEKLFEIIRLNAKTLMANLESNDPDSILSNDEFQTLLKNNKDNEQLDKFINHMNQLYINQNYLTKQVFLIYKNYMDICQNLETCNISTLNQAQQKVVKNYKDIMMKNISIISSLSLSIEENETGTPYILDKKGYTTSLLIILTTIAVGLNIAWFFISKLK